MSKRLGKGLNALIGEMENNELNNVNQISVKELRTNPYQPRKTFDADALEELRISIEEYGIFQPLIVRKSIKGYEIVAGERRFRAAKMAGLEEVPAIVKDFDDSKMMEIALLENLQREDLTIIEEALAYKGLIDELNITQEELSEKIGKSRSHISNTIRLLSLPDEVIDFVNNKELSMGHARAILGLKDKSKINALIKSIIKKDLNVRQVESLVNEMNMNESQTKKEKTKTAKKDIFIIRQEEILREHLGTNVNINKNKNKGKIEIDFYSDDELTNIINILNNKEI